MESSIFDKLSNVRKSKLVAPLARPTSSRGGNLRVYPIGRHGAVQRQKDRTRDEQREMKRDQAGSISACLFFQGADDRRRDETAEAAERIDERDAAGRGFLLEERRRQAPGRAERRFDANHGDAEPDQHNDIGGG